MTKRQYITAIITDKRGRVLSIGKNDPTVTTATVYDKRGRVLSVAQNNFLKTHPTQARFAKQANIPLACYLHAEVLAIIRAQKRGIPFRITVERYFKNGKPGLAKPCAICELAIKESGISQVEYTM